MSLIVDDLVPPFELATPVEIEDYLEYCVNSIPSYRPDYKHMKCGCGGIIGMYNRSLGACVCEKCGKEFKLYELPYDYLKINGKTGWIFPVIRRRD